MLERFIDDMANIWKNVICIGTGNEAASAGHAAGVLTEGKEEVIQLAVENRQTVLASRSGKIIQTKLKSH